MSYWMTLRSPGTGATLEVEPFEDGGVYALGGSTEASLNVTYNYGKPCAEVGYSLRQIHGQTGAESAPALRAAVEALGTDQDEDYWKPTRGNAGHALSILLRWAEQHPDGVWEVS